MGAAPAQEGGAGRGGDWAAERNPPPGRGGWERGGRHIRRGIPPPDDDRGAAISPLAGGAPIWVPPGPAQGGSQGASPARAGQRSAGADGAGGFPCRRPFIDAGFCILLFWQEVGIL